MAEVRNFLCVSQMGGKGPSTWAILHFFPQATSRNLDQKWSWDTNWHLCGMAVQQATALPATPATPPAPSLWFLSNIIQCHKHCQIFLTHNSFSLEMVEFPTIPGVDSRAGCREGELSAPHSHWSQACSLQRKPCDVQPLCCCFLRGK